MSDNVKDVKAAEKAAEADVPQSITKTWLERRVAQVVPHLGIHETEDGTKGYFRTRAGLQDSFVAVGKTWRAVAERIGLVRKESK